MTIRQRLFVDKEVQGVLVGRVLLYWIAGVLYVSLGSIGFQYFNTPDMTLSEHLKSLYESYWAWIPSAVLILPLIIFDVLRLSHRFAGPKHRLCKTLATLRNDSSTDPTTFRSNDYWRDLAIPVNLLQEHIAGLRQQVAELSEQCESLKSEQFSRDSLKAEKLAPARLPPQSDSVVPVEIALLPNLLDDEGPRTQSGTRLATEPSR